MFTIAEQRLTVMAPKREEDDEAREAFTLEFSTNPADASRKRLRLIPSSGLPICEFEWQAGGKTPETGPVWQAHDRQPFDHRPTSQATADELAAMTPAERTLHEKDHFVAPPEKEAAVSDVGKGKGKPKPKSGEKGDGED